MSPDQNYSNVAELNAPVGNQVSDTDINSFVQQNMGNPQAIADAAQQYGISPERLSQVTGYDMGTVNDYFGNAGVNMWGQPAPQVQATTPEPIPPQAPIPPQTPIYQEPPAQTTYLEGYRGSPTDFVDPRTQGLPQAATGYGTSAGIASLPPASTRTPEQIQQDIIEQERQRQVGALPAQQGIASLGTAVGSTAPIAQATTPAPVTPPPPKPKWTGGIPSVREYMDATGETDALKAAGVVYNVVGSNEDTRDWSAIMNSADPAAAARAATTAMYGGPGRIELTGTGGMLVGADGTRLTSDLSRYNEFGIELDPAQLKAQRDSIKTNTPTGRAQYQRIDAMYQKSLQDQQAKQLAATKAATIPSQTAQGVSTPASTSLPPVVSPTGTSLPPPPVTPPIAPTVTPPVAPIVTPPTKNPEETKYGTATPYTSNQIKDYISSVMGDSTLAPWQQTNKIMEQAQAAGISQDDLRSIYGKDVVDPYFKTYGAGIKDYITSTLGDTTKSDFDKVASINQAANKYGLDASEIAKYSGLNKAGVDQMFTAFDTGLAGIVKGLSAPTVSDLDKTKGALALQSKYGISDDQIAKALGGNVTGKDVAAYLEPVKTFGTKLQDFTSDQTKTASDIQTFLDNAKKDPRIEGLYGLAIDKVQKAVPILGLRDSIAGNGSPEQLVKGYTDFVAAVNSDPALKEKYGAQADAIDQVAKMSQRIADEKFGGKLQPHMFQTFIGLDQKTLADVPKQLEVGKSETKTYTDSEGQTQTYTVPGQVKDTKGLEPVYTTTGSGEDSSQQLTGYTKPIKTAAGVIVDAQYDANGTLTGYRGRPEDKVWPAHRVGVTGVWDADGKAKPEQKVETVGFGKNLIKDVSDLGPIGQLAIAFATSGLGSLAAGALTPALGATAAKVVTSGIINGAMAEMGGGKFGKGFLTGAAGAGTNVLAQNYMPTINTGSAFADQYLTKALPNLATSTIGAALNKKDIGEAGISSLLNTGTNMATSSLINSAMPDTLTPEMQKMFTGVSGQLLSSLLQGQSPDLQKSIMNTIMQNAMSQSKTTAKEKG